MFLIKLSIGVFNVLNMFNVLWVLSRVIFCGVDIIIVLVSCVFWYSVSCIFLVFGGILIRRIFNLFYVICFSICCSVFINIGFC